MAGLGACGSGGGAQSSAADRSFLDAVHGADPGISSYRTDVQLTRLGHVVCDGFRSGASFEQLADRLALVPSTKPLPAADLGSVITAAVGSYCPQYRSLVGGA